ncbi:hypothetical protein K3495_g6740 [Podosphaera aphanis]|nr:hypothetical protein K3495_g6740 [Podosphaera aphanis]
MEETPFVSDSLPDLGILSQTVVSSPFVKKILLARLRDTPNEDIIFIGNDFVQVREVLNDGHLYDVVRKEGFGSRIRNAQVIGSVEDYEQDFGDIKRDLFCPDSVEIPRKTVKSKLPPQNLVLQLCSGDIVFLGIQLDKYGNLELVSQQRRRNEKPTHKLQAGMHFVVDSSSRYIALGCSEGIFAIYALNSRKKMQEQLLMGSSLQFIESGFHLFSDGAILNMEFLHPGPDDNNYITLLVTKALMGQTRMFFFRWEAGCDVSKIRPHNPNGILLQDEQKLPLLVIPLTITAAFMLVYETKLSIYQGILTGNPTIADFKLVNCPTLPHYNGKTSPLWTAWARPQRNPPREIRDYIHLIREDGMLMYFEIDREVEGLISSDYRVAEFEESCGTAFACIHFYGGRGDLAGDLAFLGGDSCFGATYLLAARADAEMKDRVPNWPAANDFTMVNSHDDDDSPYSGKVFDSHKSRYPQPDRIFACVCKGINGAVAEFQHGLEARIALISDYDVAILQSWVFHETIIYDDAEESEAIFLLALSNSSTVLRLDTDGNFITELNSDFTKFDLRYRTIAASEIDGIRVQVTEKSIVTSRFSSVFIYNADDLLQVQLGGCWLATGNKIHNSAIGNGFVIFTTSIKDITYLQILVFENMGNSMIVNSPIFLTGARVGTIGKFSSHVACLALSQVSGIRCVIVSEWDDEKSTLNFISLDSGSTQFLRIPIDVVSSAQIISISAQLTDPDNFFLFCGTRDGLLITLEIHRTSFFIVASRCDRIGATSVIITRDKHSIYGHFIVCDSCLFALVPRKACRSQIKNDVNNYEITRFWFTEALKYETKQPEISSIASRPPFQLIGNNRDCLLISGSHVIIASLQTEIKTIPRQITFGGTPFRIIYSSTTKALIVAASLDSKSTVLFMDPVTGDNLSHPIDQNTKKPVEFISGLGHKNEKIFSLFEWIYTKEGRKWSFIIVSTSLGRVLIISVDNLPQIKKEFQNMVFQPISEKEGGKKRSKISYYTRYKFWAPEPIYSVVGYPDGLLWCAGNTLFCDALDLKQKKFKRIAKYELPSPAVDLKYKNGNIYTLTLSHSLEIFKLVTSVSGAIEIVRTHGDPITRPALSHLIYNSENTSSVHLVSDKMSKLVGLRPTHNAIMETLEVVFEARLPESIVKFRYGECRPRWDPTRNEDRIREKKLLIDKPPDKFERALMNLNKSEIMGLSITGSLIHFTILDIISWKFLRFLSILALRSPKVCEFTYRDNLDLNPLKFERLPKISMHIDGDLLKRCLQGRLIEDLLEVNIDKQSIQINPSKVTLKDTKYSKRLYEILQELHGESLPLNQGIDVYIKQAYCDLEFILRPVI